MRIWTNIVLLCFVSVGWGCKDGEATKAAQFVEGETLGVKVAEASANNGTYDVPIGRHLAHVDYNSLLHVTPVVSTDRAQLLIDLSKLINAVNLLSESSARNASKLMDGSVKGLSPQSNSALTVQDRNLLRALRAKALRRFSSPDDEAEPTAIAAVRVMARAITAVNEGSDQVANLRMTAILRQAQTQKSARIHIAGYDDLTNDGTPKSIFERVEYKSPEKPASPPNEANTASGRFLEALQRVPALKPVLAARTGLIDLSETPAEHGDYIDIIVKLLPAKAPANAANTPNAGSSDPSSTPRNGSHENAVATNDVHDDPADLPSEGGQTLEVDRLGWSYRLSADVLFVNRFGGSDATKEFVAAPSASLTLHYHQRLGEDDRDSTFWKVWNELGPGIGFNVAALNFENGTEVGVGGHISLFHDVFKIGYGYDVSAGKDPQYWYFGIGIFETLNQIGKLGRDLTK